jgi:hypothetical protein
LANVRWVATPAPSAAPRIGKGDEEAVARVVDLLSTVLGEQRPQRPVVPADEVLPGLVPDRLEQSRRAHDVREEERAGHGLGSLALHHAASACASRSSTVRPVADAYRSYASRQVVVDAQGRLMRVDGIVLADASDKL